jgi:hypothetical protein
VETRLNRLSAAEKIITAIGYMHGILAMQSFLISDAGEINRHDDSGGLMDWIKFPIDDQTSAIVASSNLILLKIQASKILKNTLKA